MGATKEAVVFLLPNGGEVSNDPRYYEEKMRQQIINQNTQRMMQDASSDDEDLGNDDGGDDLDRMSAADLKKEVARLKDEEGIDIDTSGVKKKSELVERIREAQANT